MKISEKQLQAMFHILAETGKYDFNIGGFSREDRIKIVNEIFHQQSDTLIDINGTDENKTGN